MRAQGSSHGYIPPHPARNTHRLNPPKGETELLKARGVVLERIQKLNIELEILKHALERVKTLQIFEETMK